MKRILLLAALTIAVASCGKKSEHLNEEKELNQQLMDMHHAQMEVFDKVDSLVTVLDGKAADSTMAAQAAVSKELLTGFKKHMDEWMNAYEMYDTKMEHEAAMKKLEKDKADLEAMNAEMAKAMEETNKVLGGQ